MPVPAVLFHVMTAYSPGQVRVRWVPDSRPRIPELDAEIERAWQQAHQRPGVRLFDLPMCRLESFRADHELVLSLSLTSYKTFLGTHYANRHCAERFGRDAMANAIGISAVVQSSDGFFLLGRRNASVAHYPHRVHTFAGTLEPEEATDVFAAMRRELNEELRLAPQEISEITCVGLIEDRSLGQPELVFDAISSLNRDEIAARLDPAEHSALVSVQTNPAQVRQILSESSLTPVASAALMLCGRRRFGTSWFDQAAGPVTLPES